MRVDPSLSTPLAATAGPQRRPAAGQAFAPSGADAASRTSGPAASAPLATMDALLAVQRETDPGERRRRSLKRGHDLLAALDGLKIALLAGKIPVGDLRALAGRVKEGGELSGDPRLDDIVAHIALRAEVELAKLAAS